MFFCPGANLTCQSCLSGARLCQPYGSRGRGGGQVGFLCFIEEVSEVKEAECGGGGELSICTDHSWFKPRLCHELSVELEVRPATSFIPCKGTTGSVLPPSSPSISAGDSFYIPEWCSQSRGTRFSLWSHHTRGPTLSRQTSRFGVPGMKRTIWCLPFDYRLISLRMIFPRLFWMQSPAVL